MITEYISKTLNIPLISEPTDHNYTCFDDGGVESSVGTLLYAMVQIIRPDYVLETGSYHGWSSSYIGLALKSNKNGMLETVEYESKHIVTCKEKWTKLGIQKHITPYFASSLYFTPTHNYQMILIDTEPPIRWAEVERFYPYLDDGGYMFVHDVPRNMCQGNINPDHPEIESWPFGNITPIMKDYLITGKLIKFHLSSPRGLLGLYKPKPDDHACR